MLHKLLGKGQMLILIIFGTEGERVLSDKPHARNAADIAAFTAALAKAK
ncbi:MAG: hypothetical protein QM730_26635 [Anaerolineales bacterium]